MDELYATLTRPGALILALCVWVLTFFIRRILEILFPSLKKRTDPGKAPYITAFSMWFNEVILYAIPVVLGGLTAFMKSEFLFGAATPNVWGRILFGCAIGWLSGFLYKAVQKVIKQKAGIDIETPGPEVVGANDSPDGKL